MTKKKKEIKELWAQHLHSHTQKRPTAPLAIVLSFLNKYTRQNTQIIFLLFPSFIIHSFFLFFFLFFFYFVVVIVMLLNSDADDREELLCSKER